MRIHQITSESTQSLEEGPLLNKIGSGIGKAVGAAAKGVGAVAGGVAGLGKAIKKGYQAGKATVGGADDDEGSETGTMAPASTIGGTTPTTTPAAAVAPATTAPAAKAAPTTTPAAAPATPTSTPAAKAAPKSAFGKLSAAANGDEPAASPTSKPAPATTTAPAANPKADTVYAQAQKAVTALAPEQRKEIVTMLQTDPKVKAAMATKPAAGKVAAPAANTMATAPVSKTNKAKPGNPNVAPTVSSTKKPATVKTATVKQKQLTPAGFGQMVGGLTKQG